MVEAHGEEAVPVGKEEHLLADTEQAGDEREERQSVLVFGRQVDRRRIKHLDKVFEARDVHFVLHRLFRKRQQFS